MGSWRKHDELFLTHRGGAHTERLEILRGSFDLHPACLSFVRSEDRRTVRHYYALHRLDYWRVVDHSATQE